MVKTEFIQEDDIPGVVRMHREVLDGGISAVIGINFLTAFYKKFINQEIGVCIAAKRNSKVVGWVVGLKGRYLWKLALGELKQKNWKFFWEIFWALTLNIGRIKDFIFKREERLKDFELYFIGVAKEEQRNGIGSKLIYRFDKELRKKGENGYFLITWDSKARQFYLKNSFIILKEMIYFGRKTSLMWKELIKPA